MVDERSTASPLSGAWGPLLAPLGLAYEGVVRARAALYRRGWLRTHWLAAPVVSVGNLTAGGSGKTPVVDVLARHALSLGLATAVLTRGYGRGGRSDLIRMRGVAGGLVSPDSLGDEPYWLAARNPDLTLCIGRSRRLAGRLAGLSDPPRLVLLDDGFQHLPLGRRLNLLLIDAGRGLGNGHVLPRGWLREPISAARRADALIVTQANLGDAERVLSELRARIGTLPPVFRFAYRPRRIARLDGGAEAAPEALAGRRVGALCAIARPEAFAATLRAAGAEIASLEARPDHDPYDEPALYRIERLLADAPADVPAWITTEKDAVKLRGRLVHADRLWVLEMAVDPDPAWEPYFTEFLARHGLTAVAKA